MASANPGELETKAHRELLGFAEAKAFGRRARSFEEILAFRHSLQEIRTKWYRQWYQSCWPSSLACLQRVAHAPRYATDVEVGGAQPFTP